ncbi:serine-protein kinase RsbW [Jannaschia seosinensis]|uniref:Serine-protein kinase RsbW n=1 Tax=Jannaschia seosinensis TaxID=313367 RepID=A0A0M7B920_9RHOB|nr:ATP-binding protein [Jannaschia seosinensis]CUH33856.1 serine-protein kinase RsbW [Jannaschia seosinensis]
MTDVAILRGGHQIGDLFHRILPGTEADVRRTIDDLRAHTEWMDLAAGIVTNALIVLSEVLNNIVEHALANLPSALIQLDIFRIDTGLLIVTTDPGRPLPPTLLSSPKLPDTNGAVDDLPEGGFGWFMIHTLAGDMMYEREDGANRLSFSFAA